MPYGSYTLAEALKKYEIKGIYESDDPQYYTQLLFEFLDGVGKSFAVSETFKADFKINVEEYATTVTHTEESLKANFILPVLREVWKSHRKALRIWYEDRLEADKEADLTGKPDYFITKRSNSPEAPYCVIVEAKKQDWEKGWGQALSAMVAAQILNEKEKGITIPVYGVVSTGVLWQFGKLVQKEFAHYPLTYFNIIDKENERMAVLNLLEAIFSECEKLITD